MLLNFLPAINTGGVGSFAFVVLSIGLYVIYKDLLNAEI